MNKIKGKIFTFLSKLNQKSTRRQSKFHSSSKKVKVVPVHTMKTYRGEQMYSPTHSSPQQ